ncbi:restriction endonuclease [Planctomycetes bacterium K23_9]|uniref:Restriction endonuclease n=1 Tax=Stieleria marina TaxID=1930275 RepID=A0A517NYB0_9BACT|nr:hypothetical protein K239x_41190 [Planctomycetes bacterium K23_9]
MPKPPLTLQSLATEAKRFAQQHAEISEASLYGVTDGKAIGTYIERRLHAFLSQNYNHQPGSSARGRDLPEVNADIKFTHVRQPQSSCPFKSAAQKIYGLGYSLLVFVYDKQDDDDANLGTLQILHGVLVDKSRTADFQTTTGLRDLVAHNATIDDILAFFAARRLPVDDISGRALAQRVLDNPPELGYLTISNALQWRLQYGRVVDQAGKVDGLSDLVDARAK